MSRYELTYVAVPRLVSRNGYRKGKWHEIAKELKPGHAIEVATHNEYKMLHRAARQLGIRVSMEPDKAKGTIWVGMT